MNDMKARGHLFGVIGVISLIAAAALLLITGEVASLAFAAFPTAIGMAYDADIMLHNPGTDLTATVTGTGKLIETTPIDGVEVRVSVPQATGTSPTLDITIQESDTLGSGYVTVVTFAQITAAGIYRRRFASTKKYARAVLTVGGTSPNFGKVQVGFTTGGEQKAW